MKCLCRQINAEIVKRFDGGNFVVLAYRADPRMAKPMPSPDQRGRNAANGTGWRSLLEPSNSGWLENKMIPDGF